MEPWTESPKRGRRGKGRRISLILPTLFDSGDNQWSNNMKGLPLEQHYAHIHIPLPVGVTRCEPHPENSNNAHEEAMRSNQVSRVRFVVVVTHNFKSISVSSFAGSYTWLIGTMLCSLIVSRFVAFDRTRSIYVVFHSRGFYDVPRVLITDAGSFRKTLNSNDRTSSFR